MNAMLKRQVIDTPRVASIRFNPALNPTADFITTIVGLDQLSAQRKVRRTARGLLSF